MTTIGKVSSTEAFLLIEHVVQEATKLGKSVVVAVAGPEGELISFIRMDDVNAGSGIIAPNKAYTAARQRKFTREIGKKIKDENLSAAYWGDDRDIAREEVLADIAAKAGLERQRFFAAIEASECKARLRANTDELIARGGFGSPTLFIGNSMFFGNDRLPLVRAALEAA